jgi:hypothetical protein
MNKALRWMWLVLALAVIYAGTTLFLRWRTNRSIEQSAAQKSTEDDRKVLDHVGGGEMKILSFYASPVKVAKGGKVLLCYGVAFAKSVSIEPQVEPIKPALSQCVEVRPAATTKYTLTATDDRGRVEKRVVDVAVR